LGGGQLGRYFVMAADDGYRTVVLEPDRTLCGSR
jgi:phosphoribosylaminoimidazole carboxylase (NCAIR synthetase)